MEENEVVTALAALAQVARLSAYRYLVVAGPQGITPGEMAESLQIAPNTLSFHLKELLNAGLISQERIGRNLVYRANFERMNELLSFLTANCCGGAECLPTSTVSCKC
jgi:DNA-binding transcriptional ArsR family regulator